VAASLLRDGKPITVHAAVLLLEIYCLRRFNIKPSDGDIRRKLKKAAKGLWRRKAAELIFQRADLIDPISEGPVSRPLDPDQWWFIEPGAFEIIKSEVVRRPALPTVIMPPIQGGDGEAENDRTLSALSDPVAQAGAALLGTKAPAADVANADLMDPDGPRSPRIRRDLNKLYLDRLEKFLAEDKRYPSQKEDEAWCHDEKLHKLAEDGTLLSTRDTARALRTAHLPVTKGGRPRKT
jgi:hypothetical protein